MIAQVIRLILLIVLMTWNHGMVTATLKVVRNNSHLLSDDDITVGMKRIEDLFFTYLVSNVVVYGVTMLTTYILFSIFGSILKPYVLQAYFTSTTSLANYLVQLIFSTPSLIMLLLVIVLIVLLVYILMSTYVFAMPYLKEQYGISGIKALKESFSLMSGHVWDYIKLELSFIGWIFLSMIIMMVVVRLLSFISIGSLIASIVYVVFSAYTFYPQYKVSQAVFFEELAYYRYEIQNIGKDDSFV